LDGCRHRGVQSLCGPPLKEHMNTHSSTTSDTQSKYSRRDVERIARRLAGVEGRIRPNGRTGFMTICPAHPDRNPSLSIRLGKNGRPLFHCFAGCERPAVIRECINRGLLPPTFLRSGFKPSFLVKRVQKQAASYSWNYPSGSTDRAVLKVHIMLASRA